MNGMLYDLSSKHLNVLMNILYNYREILVNAVLFGSRVRGDFKQTSDIDLAVTFSRHVQASLASDFDKSSLPYVVDIVDRQNISNRKLLENIDRDGKILFLSDRDDVLMTVEQVKIEHVDFSRALQKLRIALDKNISEDDLYLDGLIQRLEFCFELAWKSMKAYLSYEGVEVNSPRSAVRSAFQIEIIDDAESWLNMLEDRNLSTHIYDEETAKVIYRHVAQKYALMFADFNAIMTTRLAEA